MAMQKSAGYGNVKFISVFRQNRLEDSSVDIVTCSPSFHWMNPETTINEVSRILKDKGVFAVYDWIGHLYAIGKWKEYIFFKGKRA